MICVISRQKRGGTNSQSLRLCKTSQEGTCPNCFVFVWSGFDSCKQQIYPQEPSKELSFLPTDFISKHNSTSNGKNALERIQCWFDELIRQLLTCATWKDKKNRNIKNFSLLFYFPFPFGFALLVWCWAVAERFDVYGQPQAVGLGERVNCRCRLVMVCGGIRESKRERERDKSCVFLFYLRAQREREKEPRSAYTNASGW